MEKILQVFVISTKEKSHNESNKLEQLIRFLLRRNDKKGVGFELFLWKKANEKEVFELKKGKTKLPIPP